MSTDNTAFYRELEKIIKSMPWTLYLNMFSMSVLIIGKVTILKWDLKPCLLVESNPLHFNFFKVKCCVSERLQMKINFMTWTA